MYSARLRAIVDAVWQRIPTDARARMGVVVFHDDPDFPHPRGTMGSAGLHDVWLNSMELERRHIDDVSFIIAHELTHVLNKHIVSRDSRNPGTILQQEIVANVTAALWGFTPPS
jgi:hypothetical protein